MTKFDQYLKEIKPRTKPEKDVAGLIDLIKGKKGKRRLPTKKFLIKVMGPEVVKDLKKGVDYE